MKKEPTFLSVGYGRVHLRSYTAGVMLIIEVLKCMTTKERCAQCAMSVNRCFGGSLGRLITAAISWLNNRNRWRSWNLFIKGFAGNTALHTGYRWGQYDVLQNAWPSDIQMDMFRLMIEILIDCGYFKDYPINIMASLCHGHINPGLIFYPFQYPGLKIRTLAKAVRRLVRHMPWTRDMPFSCSLTVARWRMPSSF